MKIKTIAINTDIKIMKIADNEVGVQDPLFKQKPMKGIIPSISHLCSMNVFNGIPADKKSHNLIEYLKGIREKYLEQEYILKQIDIILEYHL